MNALKDRVAIVTGAGSGMGEAISKRFAAEGAKVVAADINQETVNRVVKEIKDQGGDASATICNVAKLEDIEKMFDFTLQQYGQVNILMNNAGIMDNFVPAGDLTDELWDRVLSVNLRGPFMATRRAVNLMLKNGGGVIINTASVGGLFGTRGGCAYTVAKHGILGLTKNTAAVYGTLGIRCCAIAPGAIETNIGNTITAPHELGAARLYQGAAGATAPTGKAEDIANTALFLASDEAKFINGAIIVVDGAWTVF